MEQITRTREQLEHQFLVEKELAARLRDSTREERKALFGKLYDELFERVPDHPRLTRTRTPEDIRRSVEARLRLLRPWLTPGAVLLEIAPGDGTLACAAATQVKKVIGADISDQRPGDAPAPDNFEMIVYDGYNLDAVEDRSVDLVFSYQFLEHLHPDDIALHFELVHRVLKPGGRYVFDTPHRYSGPHDIARYFTDELVCFHFQEYTYRGMRRLLRQFAFSKPMIYRFGKPLESGVATGALMLLESIVGVLPKTLRRRASERLFPSVTMTACRES